MSDAAPDDALPRDDAAPRTEPVETSEDTWTPRQRVYRARRKVAPSARREVVDAEPPRRPRSRLRRLILTVLSLLAALYLWTKFQPHPAPPGLEDVPYVEPGLFK